MKQWLDLSLSFPYLPRNPINCIMVLIGVIVVPVIMMLTWPDHPVESNGVDDGFVPGLCFTCSHSSEAISNEPRRCHLLDTLETAELMNHTTLTVDGQSKGCPIEAGDELYPFVARMMESDETIFEQMAPFDAPELMVTIPPKWDNISESLQNEYSMNGLIVVENAYVGHQVQNGGKTHELTQFQWTEQLIEEYVARVKRNDFSDNKLYGPEPGSQLSTLLSSERFDEIMAGGEALVIGSQSPWLEAILLSKGMKHGLFSSFSLTVCFESDLKLHSDHGGVWHYQRHSFSDGMGASIGVQQGGR